METIDFSGIACQVLRRNRGRGVRIAFRGGRLQIVLPRNLDPLPIMNRHKQWILKKHEWFRRQHLLAETLELVCRSNQEFLDLVRDLIRRYAGVLAVKPSGIGFRKMKSKWGSCNPKGKISLNTWLQALPDEPVAFVVYHELAHLKVRNHGPDFKALIRAEFPDFRALDKKLRLYSLKIL
ncbi:MAG: M48 family metallopeptidase [Candidatus Aminicenantes bacterium]|jgi:predicted metal-dependent hydrolase|nr:M48 family metallopeptidase [Candidatus Aminicenantes bacterium]